MRELYNERQRVLRAHAKLEGLKALKDDLRRYLQPEDYEYLLDRLQREVERRSKKEESELFGQSRMSSCGRLLRTRASKGTVASAKRCAGDSASDYFSAAIFGYLMRPN
jgi:hypothetical protein